MSSSSHRPASPGGRRTVQPDRSAVGGLYKPLYDNSGAPTRSARAYASLPRTVMDRSDASRVIPVRQRSPPRLARDDDYNLKPRRVSLGPGEPGARRPLSLMAPRSPNRNARPIITNQNDRPSSPLSKSFTSKSNGVQLEASYIIPASSSSGRHHHRHSSLTSSDRLQSFHRDPRDRIYVGGTRAAEPSQVAPRTRPDEPSDRDYSYEYTGPKKEFLRESAPSTLPRLRERRDSVGVGRERPKSMLIPDRQEPEYRRLTRESGPPPSARGLDHQTKADYYRQHQRLRDDVPDGRYHPGRGYLREARDDTHYRSLALRNKIRDDDFVPYPEENPRHSRPRKSTLEENEATEARSNTRRILPDGGRSEVKPRDSNNHYEKGDWDRSQKHQGQDSNRESADYEEKDRKRRSEKRGQKELPDDNDKYASLAGGRVASAAAVGLAAEGVRRHRQKAEDGRYTKSPKVYLPEADREREGSESTSLSGGLEDEIREERRHRRRQGRQREESIDREAGDHERKIQEGPKATQADQGAPAYALHPQHADAFLREQTSYEHPLDDETMLPRHVPQHRPNLPYCSDSSISSNDGDAKDDTVAPNPRVVTPSAEDSRPALPAPPPKGILKKARDKFPEPLNPVREGVAPLDAAKKGIPPEARWTRINRRLVNPEALEQDGLRFEEFPDHVIVLKVLNQEEITRYAQKTHEIREKRRAMHGPPEVSGSSGEPSHD